MHQQVKRTPANAAYKSVSLLDGIFEMSVEGHVIGLDSATIPPLGVMFTGPPRPLFLGKRPVHPGILIVWTVFVPARVGAEVLPRDTQPRIISPEDYPAIA